MCTVSKACLPLLVSLLETDPATSLMTSVVVALIALHQMESFGDLARLKR